MSSRRIREPRRTREGKRRERVRRQVVALAALLAVCVVLIARLGERGGPRWYWHENSERPTGALSAL